MKITIVGTGYVGLVSGTCFAEVGLDVTCVDIDSQKIDNLKKGNVPIYEPGLDILIGRNVDAGRLQFTTDYGKALNKSEAVFIAVGTPPGEDGSANLNHVLSAAREIGKVIDNYIVIATKSTVPIGTAQKIREAVNEQLIERKVEITFDVASNPEFLKEGNAVEDFLKPDRIIIGSDSERAEKIMNRLYKPFLLNGHPLIYMDINSAEMTKYAANALLATKISFINEIANLCERTGANVNLVRQGIASDPRIGNRFIYPGVGYGGSCFPKDIRALIKTGEEFGYPMKIINAVNLVNDEQRKVIVKKISKHYKNNLEGRIFSIWGLSFKPETSDTRESPAMYIINDLINAGCTIKAYDPIVRKGITEDPGSSFKIYEEKNETLIDSSGLILVTEWSEFRILNYPLMVNLMRDCVVFDGRNIYDRLDLKENGIEYYGIGS